VKQLLKSDSIFYYATFTTQRGDSSAAYRTVYRTLLEPSATVEVDLRPCCGAQEAFVTETRGHALDHERRNVRGPKLVTSSCCDQLTLSSQVWW